MLLLRVEQVQRLASAGEYVPPVFAHVDTPDRLVALDPADLGARGRVEDEAQPTGGGGVLARARDDAPVGADIDVELQTAGTGEEPEE